MGQLGEAKSNVFHTKLKSTATFDYIQVKVTNENGLVDQQKV